MNGIPDPGRASKAVEMVVAGCSTPDKQTYRSQAEANRAERERRSRGNRERLYPYECSAGGHWHLTHHTPETQRAVFDGTTGAVGLAATTNVFDGFNIRHVFTDQPLWIGRDVCEAVGISKYRDALAQLDDDERVYVIVDTPGGPQKMSAVTESGVWSLLLISRSPQAKPFKRWLTHEVLPSIRRDGRYDPNYGNVALPDRKTMAQWVIEAETRAEIAEARNVELTEKIADDAPKVNYVELYVADADLLKFRTIASANNVSEHWLRELLVERDWIYVETESRFSERKGVKEIRRRYSAYSHKRQYFRPVEVHEAPRFKGEVMHTLKVTPAGAEAIARLIAKEVAA